MNYKAFIKTVAFTGIILSAFATAGCSDYQDDINAVNRRIDELEGRVGSLETTVINANENITALQQIVNNAYDGYVVSVTETDDGYVLTFGDGTSVTIHNGKPGDPGTPGHTPAIGLKQDTDGNWYWTLDGNWLLDGSGNKVRANGTDGAPGTPSTVPGPAGVTPQLRINATTNEWEVSYDEGKTWTSLGVKATGEQGAPGEDGEDGADGDAFFKSVTVGTDNVTFVLADGTTTFELPLFDEFKKVRDRAQSIVYVPDYFDGQIGVTNGEAVTLRYQVKPAAVATWLADHTSAMQLIGEDVIVTRSTSASLTVTGATSADGLLAITATPADFEAQKGYAFALDIEADGSSYRTAYTPAFLIVLPERIAIGVNGLYPGMGTVTAGKYLQLFAVFFPDYVTSRGITWESSDLTRATVNKTGVVAVTEKAADGPFTITATSTNGKTASLKFNIVDEQLQIDTDQLNQYLAE